MKTFVGSVRGKSENEVIVSDIVIAVHNVEDGKPGKGWGGKDDEGEICVELTSLTSHSFNMQLTRENAIRLAKLILQALG